MPNLTTTLRAVIAKCEKATPGPWKSQPSIHGSEYRYVELDHADNYCTLELLPADADLIARMSPEFVRAMAESALAADEFITAWDESHDPTIVGSTCRLIRAESNLRDARAALARVAEHAESGEG